MENGIIPLRHGSLPGSLRLPKRYEILTAKSMSPSRKRKSFIALAQPDTEDERMHDLMQAILWVKQELTDVFARLREFWIVAEIPEDDRISQSRKSSEEDHSDGRNCQILLRQHDILLKRQFCDIQHTISSLHRGNNRRYDHSLKTTSTLSLQSNDSGDIMMDNYSVRSASSVTALDEEDTDEDDTFRPRTSSMKTTRDLAALARRRGSKELI